MIIPPSRIPVTLFFPPGVPIESLQGAQLSSLSGTRRSILSIDIPSPASKEIESVVSPGVPWVTETTEGTRYLARLGFMTCVT